MYRTEALNGIIELGRRAARGQRDPTNYRRRMLLIIAGLDTSPISNHEDQFDARTQMYMAELTLCLAARGCRW